MLVIILGCGMGPEAALDSHLCIVKDDTAGNTAIVLKSADNGIQKALQILPLVSDDIRGAAVTEPAQTS